jgi:hypothetical protein
MRGGARRWPERSACNVKLVYATSGTTSGEGTNKTNIDRVGVKIYAAVIKYFEE